MNRKKKINAILKKKMKRAKSRLNYGKKPRYIPKAEREKMETEANEQKVSKS